MTSHNNYIPVVFRYIQIRLKKTWFCKPLMESEFRGAVKNYSIKKRFSYGLSHQQVCSTIFSCSVNMLSCYWPHGATVIQVAKLLHLFSSRNRLRFCQNPRLKDDLPREVETSPVKVTQVQSSPNSSSCGSFRSPCQTCSCSNLAGWQTNWFCVISEQRTTIRHLWCG
jgi:hypothetical protein